MHLKKPRASKAALLIVLAHFLPAPAAAQPAGTVRVRIDALKRSTWGHYAADGPVLIGPQSALELEWRVANQTGAALDIPSMDAVLRLRVTGPGGDIAV